MIFGRKRSSFLELVVRKMIGSTVDTWTRPRKVNESKSFLKIWTIHRDQIHNIRICQEKQQKQKPVLNLLFYTWGHFHQPVYAQLYAPRSQKYKKLLNLTVFFVLSGSEHVKAARKC